MSDTEDKSQSEKTLDQSKAGMKKLRRVVFSPLNEAETSPEEFVPPWRKSTNKRPLTDEEPVTLSFRVKGKDLKELTRVTNFLGITKSAFIRTAIDKLLWEEQKHIEGEMRERGLRRFREEEDSGVPF